MPNDDEDAIQMDLHVKQQGRPNAYWQRVREGQEPEPDTFGGSFRATKPSPHGGAATVHPEDTLGTDELCWCGRPAGHHWPGKSVGTAHPKGMDMKEMTAVIDRRDLRGYHRQLQDFLMECINTQGLRFRIAKNSIVLFPPDGGPPATVYARNTDRQMRQLAKWYLNHVEPTAKAEADEDEDTEPVTEEQIEALAKAKNDPAEHPQHKREPEPDLPKTEPPRKDHRVREEAELPGPDSNGAVAPPLDEAEWRPHLREKDGPSPNIYTNGTMYKCIWCEGTDHEFLTDSKLSIGGHNRMNHSENAGSMHTPEARAKATDSMRHNKLRAIVVDHLETLMKAVDYETGDPEQIRKLTAENERLQRENKRLAKENGDVETLRARVEEAEAKLALIREATGL